MQINYNKVSLRILFGIIHNAKRKNRQLKNGNKNNNERKDLEEPSYQED